MSGITVDEMQATAFIIMRPFKCQDERFHDEKENKIKIRRGLIFIMLLLDLLSCEFVGEREARSEIESDLYLKE